MNRIKKFICQALCCLFPLSLSAQSGDNSQMLKQANNPLADIKAFSVHNYYTPRAYGSSEGMNSMWFRYTQPVGRVLLRASLPVNTIPSAEAQATSGLGDFTMLGAYLLTKPSSSNQIGLGPVITAPTATSTVLGSGKWQAGAALAGYFAGSNTMQLGFLGIWQHSFAGDALRQEVNVMTLQPFLMWQLGKGYYLRSTGIAMLDFENDNYYVPLGLGAGKIIRKDNLVFNLFVEPQYTVYQSGVNVPRTQIFIGINTQF